MNKRLPEGTLRKRGRIYWAQWKHQAVPYAVSLGTKDPEEAKIKFTEQMMVVRASIVEGSHHGKFGRKGVPPPIQDGDIRLADAWDCFAHSPRRSDCSPQTLHQYSLQFDRFLHWAKDSRPDILSVSQVDEPMAEEFASCLEREVSSPTYNKYRDILVSIFDILLAKSKAGTPNPWKALRRKNGSARKRNGRREFTDDEVRRIFQVLLRRIEGFEPVPSRNGRVYERTIPNKEKEAATETFTLCLIGFHTGLRLVDCCLMEWAEVDMAARRITVVPRKTARTSGETVVIPIHAELLAHLAAIRPAKPGRRVMPGKAEQYMKNRSNVVKRLATVFRHAGISLHKKGTGGSSGIRAAVEAGFHSFRHRWVSCARRNGVDQASVQAVAGWSSPAMIRNYAHVPPEHLEKQLAAMPSAMGGVLKAEAPAASIMSDDELKKLAESLASEMSRRGLS